MTGVRQELYCNTDREQLLTHLRAHDFTVKIRISMILYKGRKNKMQDEVTADQTDLHER